MQRAAQRDDRRDQRDQRAGRLRRVLVCAAAVPAVLVVAGCSSDSGSAGKGAEPTASSGSGSGSSSVSPSPTVQAAAYGTLPKACAVLSKKTLGDLVPKGTKSAKEGASDDAASRASCSWSSLDNNGVKGSQFRWLNVSLLRFDSDVHRGSGDKQAEAYYAKQVQDAQSVAGAKSTRATSLAGTGDQATAVRYDLKKKEGAFKQQTVVARVENVVVTVDYNGAGLAGDKSPSADDLAKAAQRAAKEAIAAVTSANGKDGGSGTAKPSPSTSAPKKASSAAS